MTLTECLYYNRCTTSVSQGRH